MKWSLTLAGLVGGIILSHAQGELNWNNTASTLISANGVPMPVRMSSETTFYFGLFIAPLGAPACPPGVAGFDDPNWQYVVDYTVNHTAAIGAGRFQNPGITSVPGFPAASTVNFMIRGWQSSSGGADWQAAKPGLFSYRPIEPGLSDARRWCVADAQCVWLVCRADWGL